MVEGCGPPTGSTPTGGWEQATHGVYWLCDAQAPVYVVQALVLLVNRALPEWAGEPAANPRSALRTFAR